MIKYKLFILWELMLPSSIPEPKTHSSQRTIHKWKTTDILPQFTTFEQSVAKKYDTYRIDILNAIY